MRVLFRAAPAKSPDLALTAPIPNHPSLHPQVRRRSGGCSAGPLEFIRVAPVYGASRRRAAPATAPSRHRARQTELAFACPMMRALQLLLARDCKAPSNSTQYTATRERMSLVDLIRCERCAVGIHLACAIDYSEWSGKVGEPGGAVR